MIVVKIQQRLMCMRDNLGDKEKAKNNKKKTTTKNTPFVVEFFFGFVLQNVQRSFLLTTYDSATQLTCVYREEKFKNVNIWNGNRN